MFQRRTLNALLLSVALLIGLAAALGEDRPAAQQLYQQGMQLFSQGKYDEAKKILRGIDPYQLTAKEQRVTLYDTIQECDRRLAKKPDMGALLKQADDARSAGALAQAAALYQSVQANPTSTEAQKQTAVARLAEVRRQINAKETAARQGLEAAAGALQAGDLDAAESQLRDVKASGVDLGWFDNQRLDGQLKLIGERRAMAAALAAAKAQPKPVPPPVKPVTPPPPAIVAVKNPTPPTPPTPTPPTPPVVAVAPVTPPTPTPPVVAVAPVTPPTPPTPPVVAVAPVTPPTPAPPKPAADDILAQAMMIRAGARAAEARQAEADGQLRTAVTLYDKSLALNPKDDKVKAARAAAQAKVETEGAPVEVLPKELATIEVRRSATVAEYNQMMNRAKDLLKGRQYTQATEAVNEAKNVLDRNKRYLPESQYSDLRGKANDLAADIGDKKVVWEAQQKVEIEKKSKEEDTAAHDRALIQKQQQVDALLRRAAELRRVQQYEAALELLNQALFIDQQSAAAQAMKEMIEDAKVAVDYREARRVRALNMTKHMVGNLEATIPHEEILIYPTDWPQLTERRLRGLEQGKGESEANRRVAMKLKDPVPINFDANELRNVIEFFRNTTGLNFFVNWPALEAVGVDQKKTISLQLTQVPAEQALKLVLQQASTTTEQDPITYSIIDGIVTISTTRDLTKTTDVRTYDIRDLLVDIPNFSNVQSFDLNSALQSSGTGGGRGGGGGGGGGGLFGGNQGGANAGQPQGKTPQERIQDITTLIEDTVGKPEQWVDRGGDVSSLKELNGNLIVKTTTEYHRQLVQLLSQLREARAMQISVEGRFLLVDQNFLDDVGVDLDVQINNLGSHWTPAKISQDSSSLAAPVTTGLSGSLGGATAGFLTGIPDFGFASTPTTGAQGFPSGGNHGLDFSIGYLDDLQVSLLVRATQASRKAISLSAPRLTFFNGQTANIMIARQIAFVSDLEPVPDAAGFRTTLGVTQSGVQLVVEGTISADRRYVTLTVQPSLADVIEIRKIQQTALVNIPSSGIGGIGGNNNNNNNNNTGNQIIFGFLEAPQLEITQIKTTVSVPDKGTIMVGGQRLVREVEVEAGVPILSKIPILNRFTTNKSTVKDERTLLILIKPTIIIQGEQEEELFPGLLQDPSKYNVGRYVGFTPGGPVRVQP